MDGQQASLNNEKEAKAMSGWGMLGPVISVFGAGIALLVVASVPGDGGGLSGGEIWALVGPGIALLVLGSFLAPGFFTLEPNETRVAVLFGAYKGTVRTVGFRWANPFYSNGPAAKTTADVRGGEGAWPTRRRSPRPCSGGNRPRPSSTPVRRSCMGR